MAVRVRNRVEKIALFCFEVVSGLHNPCLILPPKFFVQILPPPPAAFVQAYWFSASAKANFFVFFVSLTGWPW